MREWKERYAALPETPPLSAPAETLITQERALRDAELYNDLLGVDALPEVGC